jgi:hypothetical protein
MDCFIQGVRKSYLLCYGLKKLENGRVLPSSLAQITLILRFPVTYQKAESSISQIITIVEGVLSQ